MSNNNTNNLPCVAVAKLDGHDGPAQVVRFTNDGKYCLTGGHDRTVKLWNPFRIDPAYTLTSTTTTSADLQQLVQPPPSALLIQNYTSGYTHPISSVATTETTTGSQILLASSDKSLIITDMVTNRVIRRLQGHHISRINSVATSHNGNIYLTASYDLTVALWDGRSRDIKPIQILKDATDSVTDIHVVVNNNNDKSSSSEDSSSTSPIIIRTASVDGCIRSYDIRRGIYKSDNCYSPITSMKQTYDKQCLAINCLDSTIRLMEIDSGELLNTYQGDHMGGNYGLEVSILADDATIVTGSEDGYCVFYDLVRANCIQKLQTSSSSSSSSTDANNTKSSSFMSTALAKAAASSSSSNKTCCSISSHPKESSIVITSSYDGTTKVWSNNNDTTRWQSQIDDIIGGDID